MGAIPKGARRETIEGTLELTGGAGSLSEGSFAFTVIKSCHQKYTREGIFWHKNRGIPR